VDEPTLALGILLTSEGPIEGLAGVACVVVKLYLWISELAIYFLFQFIDGLTLQRLKVIFAGRRFNKKFNINLPFWVFTPITQPQVVNG
jgi:hypothetical protein